MALEHPAQRYRRLEPVNVVFAAAWLAGCALVLLLRHPPVLAVTVAAADGMAAFYLTGPAAAITVTPSRVVVDNPYRRHDIPREAIASTESPWLLLKSGTTVRLAALSLNLPKAYPRRLGRHDTRTLQHMLTQVPPAADHTETTSSPRRLNIALAALTTTITIALVVIILTS
jgi:hypothetical protein